MHSTCTTRDHRLCPSPPSSIPVLCRWVHLASDHLDSSHPSIHRSGVTFTSKLASNKRRHNSNTSKFNYTIVASITKAVQLTNQQARTTHSSLSQQAGNPHQSLHCPPAAAWHPTRVTVLTTNPRRTWQHQHAPPHHQAYHSDMWAMPTATVTRGVDGEQWVLGQHHMQQPMAWKQQGRGQWEQQLHDESVARRDARMASLKSKPRQANAYALEEVA